MSDQVLDWLLGCNEPWTRYRTLRDLKHRPVDDPVVRQAYAEMAVHPQIQALQAEAAAWPGRPLTRHNDASHPLYAFSTLADFGLQASDAGLASAIGTVMAHQSSEGAFQTVVNIPTAFGGSGEDIWTWIACDAPTLLYVLLAMGQGADPHVRAAVEHLCGLVADNGWHCTAAPELGKFKGPGRRSDPCPIANVYALKALSQVPELLDSAATRRGVEMLLTHWTHRGQEKFYLFGIGSDFCKLKYPFVWYDILHVADVLSRFPFVHADPRFAEMVQVITTQADRDGRYTATSMYRAWKHWSFADKKAPSPWLTFLVRRIHARVQG